MIDVCLLGTGGMMPLPYRWLTSLALRYNGRTILLDCGEGTQIALKKAGWSPNPIDVILFTHYHGDHIAGLPGMLLSMGNADRTEPVLLAGPRGLEKVVSSLRVIAPELPFELRYKELTENEESFPLPDAPELRITARKVNHRVTCYCYSFELGRQGRFDAQRAKELSIPLPYWSRLQKGETIEDGGRVYTPDMVLGPAREGLKVAYATDSRPCGNIVKAAEGADLFICEGMYGDEEKLPKAREKKHMTPEQFLSGAQQIFPPVSCGKDGRSLTLNFKDE